MLTKKKMLAAAVAVTTVAGACGSSKSGSSSGAGGSGKTFTVGILTDYTGPGASGNKTSVQGVQAAQQLAKRDGYTINYVICDDTTNPATAQTAAQKCVQQDHVFAVIAVSAVAFGAAQYLNQQHVPVIGAAEDFGEWITDNNMYSVLGAVDTTKVSTLAGDFFKMEGATTVGSIGYSISPTSAESAKASAVSAENAGLKVGYLNASFPFGGTNVQPEALAMKNAGVDGMTASVDPNTGLDLITALRQVGDPPKVAFLPTGYGGDLQQAGPGALASANGVYFYTVWEPVEMHTAATEQLQKDLTAAGVTGDPTYAEYAGYTSVAMLVDGLKAAGSHPTQASLLSAVGGLKNYDERGLLGAHGFNVGDKAAQAIGATGCEFFVKLNGSNFDLVPGADPLCGTQIPGKTVSAS